MAKTNDPRTGRDAGESSANDLEENRQWDGAQPGDREGGSLRNFSAAELREQGQRVVAQNPYSSVLTGFGLGFGFGLAVTLLLTRREETWYERHFPESVQEWPNRLKKVPETVASQVSQAWNRW